MTCDGRFFLLATLYGAIAVVAQGVKARSAHSIQPHTAIESNWLLLSGMASGAAVVATIGFPVGPHCHLDSKLTARVPT